MKRLPGETKYSTRGERRQMARRWRALRKRHHLTQAQLAKLIAIDRTEVSWIETAKRYPFPATIERFEVVEMRLERNQRQWQEAHGSGEAWDG